MGSNPSYLSKSFLIYIFRNIPLADNFLIFQIKFQNGFDPIITCSVEQGGEFLSDTDTLL